MRRQQGALRMMASRVVALLRRRNAELDGELDEELLTHIELCTEDYVRRGMTAREARRAALKSFGGVAQTRERYRSQRGLPMFENLRRECWFGLRQLRKSPGFTATVVVTLALGVGAVTAIFSVVSGVLLRPYDFEHGDRIVVWRETVRELEKVAPVLPDNYRHYLNLKAHASTIEDAAILQNPVFSVAAESAGDSAAGSSDAMAHPRMTEGLAVSTNFFSLVGVKPLLGRTFTADEGESGKDREIVLTWGAWQRLYHGSAAVLGATLHVNGVAETVIGVLPRSFRFPVVSMMPGQATFGSTERYEMFRPLVPTANELEVNDGDFNYLVMARLKAGVTAQQAQSELDGIEKATAVADHLAIHPGVIVMPFAQEITGDVRKPLWLLLAAVLGVLLMACVNLANLQIARGVAREHEMALRAALGAGRSRLLLSALVENMLLGIAGGLGGIMVAVLGERLLLVTAASLPRVNEVHLSAPMLALAMGLAVLTSIGFGILPALRGMQATPQGALKSNATRLAGGVQAARSRRVLVTIEVACSMTLLVVTALIARSFSHLVSQDRAFNAQNVVMARTDLGAPRFSGSTVSPTASPAASPAAGPASGPDANLDAAQVRRGAIIDQTLDHLRSLPAVDSVAMINVLPLSGDMSKDTLVRPDHPLPPGQQAIADRRFTSPGYFRTMGIAMLEGRDFDAHDRGDPRVVILSQKAARNAFPEGDAMGHLIRHWGENFTVVGMVADARVNDLKRETAIFYLPYWSAPPMNPVYLVRSAQTIETLGPAMRQVVWSVDPDISIPTVITLDEQVNESVAAEKFQAMVLTSFGMAALLLAVLGVYGVMAYSVTQRMQEFGIRLALGSSRGRLAWLVLKDAGYPTVAGIVLGLGGAAAAVRWVRSMLYDTSVVDPWAVGLSIIVLLLAALAAALLPMRSATAVDPMRTLRAE